jgi:hypothetical protein
VYLSKEKDFKILDTCQIDMLRSKGGLQRNNVRGSFARGCMKNIIFTDKKKQTNLSFHNVTEDIFTGFLSGFNPQPKPNWLAASPRISVKCAGEDLR